MPDVMKDSETAPPEFGHAMLKYFAFAKGYINLNHGSYGSMPLPVLDATEVMTRQIEERPDKFLRVTFRKHLNEARERVAKLIKAETDECVIIPNATHGVSTVLLNIEWKAGDVLIGFSTTYGAVSRAMRAIADRSPHPTLKVIPVVYPIRHTDLLELFRRELESIPRHEDQTIIAVMDGISSKPGVVVPWEAMCKICKEQGVLSLVDAAHVIGQMDVDLGSTQPDFWTSNCHKWLLSKRASAVLYVPRRNQHLIKFTLPISFGYVSPHDPPPQLTGADRFVKLFESTGTVDHVPLLSIVPALKFRESIGGEARINAYCHALAIEGGRRLAETLGTAVMDETGELTANMTNVLLPWPAPKSLTANEFRDLQRELCNKLLDEHNCIANLYVLHGKWWARCSAQIWNEVSDFEYLGRALLQIGEEMASSA